MVCVCMVHCAKKYCVTGYLIDRVVCGPARIVDWCRWPAVWKSIWCACNAQA